MSQLSDSIEAAIETADEHLNKADDNDDDYRKFVDEIVEAIKLVQWSRERAAKMKPGLLANGVTSLINDKERQAKAALLRVIIENCTRDGR